MDKKIILCMGLPASGKSTWSKEYCLQHPEFVKIGKDYIREFLGNQQYTPQNEHYIVTTEREIAKFYVECGKSIIVDDTNFNSKIRNYWFEYAEKVGYKVEIQYFDTPLEECIERDKNRKISVGKEVIVDMYNKYYKNGKLPKI